jgi:hypothetical protein
MKESSCLSAKMAAYCQEVRQLEDRFDGLELNHITRRLNKAADTLAKMASDKKPVPTSIFASDQYKPSVCYEELERVGDEPPAPSSVAHQPPAPPEGHGARQRAGSGARPSDQLKDSLSRLPPS